MKVILNEYIDKLGQEGDVVDIPRGYARNYLIPNKKVMHYSAQSLAEIESKRKLIEQKKKERANELLSIKEKIAATSLEFELKAGNKGVLFGSVTPHMVVEKLELQGISLNRKQVSIPHNLIKHIGSYTLTVQLSPRVSSELKITVVNSDPVAEQVPEPTTASEPTVASEHTTVSEPTAASEPTTASEPTVVSDTIPASENDSTPTSAADVSPENSTSDSTSAPVELVNESKTESADPSLATDNDTQDES